LSSRHSAAFWPALKRSGTANPPLSTVQYGMPVIEKPSPPGICFLKADQVDVMSPDQTAEA